MVTIHITTESGGVYELDVDGRRYRKTRTTDESLVGITAWQQLEAIKARTEVDQDFWPIEHEEIKPGMQLVLSGRGPYDWIRTSFVVNVHRICLDAGSAEPLDKFTLIDYT